MPSNSLLAALGHLEGPALCHCRTFKRLIYGEAEHERVPGSNTAPHGIQILDQTLIQHNQIRLRCRDCGVRWSVFEFADVVGPNSFWRCALCRDALDPIADLGPRIAVNRAFHDPLVV